MIEFLVVASIVGAIASAAGGCMVHIYGMERKQYLAIAGAEALERKLTNALFQPQQSQEEATEVAEKKASARSPEIVLPLGENIPVQPLEKSELEDLPDLIDRLMLDDDGKEILQHYRLMGATRTGKTTLGEHLIRRIQGDKPAQKFLINPKHRESDPAWSIPPFVKSIDKALEGLQRIERLLIERVSDRHFNLNDSPLLFAVIDEWDWIFEVHGYKALSALRALFKVGAELGVFVVLLGQSPLSKDTGLSQSDNQNFCQIILNSEAIKLLSGASFFHRNRDELYQQACQHQEAKDRFALVMPREGKPFVSTIPYLQKLDVAIAPKHISAQKLSTEQSKVAFLYSIPSEIPQHEQPLASHLAAILRYARRRGGNLKMSEIQPAKLPELEGKTAEEIREYFRELAALRRVELEGAGGNLTLAVLGAG